MALAWWSDKEWWKTAAPLLVALAAVISSAVVEIYRQQKARSLKQYEVTFLAKQAAYAEVIKTMTAEFFASYQRDKPLEFYEAQDRFWNATVVIRPFLDKEDYQELRRECFVRADTLCQDVFFKRTEDVKDHKAMATKFETIRNIVEDALYKAMFEDSE